MRNKLPEFVPEFYEGQQCTHVYDRGYAVPIEPADHASLQCPMCKGKRGFPVSNPPGETWWSCAEYNCIQVNAKRPWKVKTD